MLAAFSAQLEEGSHGSGRIVSDCFTLRVPKKLGKPHRAYRIDSYEVTLQHL